ncbi:MAG: ATP-binding protein [Thermodesulfobacteriota bacterium]
MRKLSAKFDFFNNISLQWKFYGIIAALLLLTAIIFTLLIERQMLTAFEEELYTDGISIGRLVEANSAKPILTNDIVALRILLTTFLEAEDGLKYLFIITPENRVLAHTFAGGFPTDLIELSTTTAPGDKISERDLDTDMGMIHEIIVPIIGGEIGYVHVGLSPEKMLASVSATKSDLVRVSVLLFMFGLVALFIFNRLISRPLASLVAAAGKIASGNLNVELPARGDDEIGALTTSFNKMAKALNANAEERGRIEKALRDSEELYRTLIENIDLGITLMDTEHNIIMVNSAQAAMFNRSEKSFTGKKCYREFEKRAEICDHCPGVEAMLTGLPKEQEAQGLLDSGEHFTVRIRAFPVNDDSGIPMGFIEVVEDITSQLRLEEELQNIKHIESIGLLAGGLAHDFNNLLAAILGNIELATINIPPEDSAVTRLNAAEEACNQAKNLTEQLLTFAKGGAPRKETTFVPKLLDDSCRFTLSGSDVKWILDAPDDIWPADLDSNQMGQVIHNLLSNALEASKPGGKIFVIAENEAVDKSSELPLAEGKYIKISIEDEGTGISPAILPKIFDPYFTTKEMGATKGTGLGLATCRSIIKKHGGHISVQSREGAGTSATLYLPKSELENSEFSGETAAPGAKSAQNESHKILLMEDDRKLAKTTANMLVHLRHKFGVAPDGDEAVRLYEEALHTDHPYNLLILDLTIRGGMGGHETLQKIRGIDPDVAAIVSSGYSDDPVMVNCQEYGFTCSLPKPYRIVDLQKAIRKAAG